VWLSSHRKPLRKKPKLISTCTYYINIRNSNGPDYRICILFIASHRLEQKLLPTFVHPLYCTGSFRSAIKEEIIIGERGRIDCRDEEERKLRLF
jgi:hypothetical protein